MKHSKGQRHDAVHVTITVAPGIMPAVEHALQTGWRVERTRGYHLKFTKAGRQAQFTSSTPSDWRAVRNAIAKLRRADREATA